MSEEMNDIQKGFLGVLAIQNPDMLPNLMKQLEEAKSTIAEQAATIERQAQEIAEFTRRIGANETAQLLTQAVEAQCLETARIQAKLTSAESERDAAKADSERLDWLEESASDVWETGHTWEVCNNPNDDTDKRVKGCGKSLREAIDAATAQEKRQ